MIVPDKDLAEINVIIALDASGSTGRERQYYMSGATLAVVKALEDTKTTHSLMIYDTRVSVVQVNQTSRSSSSNVLAGNMVGGGGTQEEPILKIAQQLAAQNSDKKTILIIMSDGGCADVRDELAKMKKKAVNKFNTYCLGFSEDFDQLYAEKIFGKEFTVSATHPKVFAKKFAGIITKELAATREGKDY